MTILLSKRRVPYLAILLALLIAALPLGGAVMAAPADGKTHVQDISFTLVTTDLLEEGEWSETDTTFSLRDSVTAEAVDGDITGTATMKMSGEFVAAGACTDEACPGYTDAWGTLNITDESGTWDGQYAFHIDDLEDSMVGKVFLIGRGENSGMAIYGDMQFLDTEDGAAMVSGHLLTLHKPAQGVRFLYDGCFVPPAGTAGHVRMHVGTGTDSGSWDAHYPLLIPGRASVGESVITTPKGSIDSVLIVQNAGSNRIGYFMLLGGTGDYESLYGFGIIRTASYESVACGDNGGAGGHWVGRAYAN
jgi:hypothetical protein